MIFLHIASHKDATQAIADAIFFSDAYGTKLSSQDQLYG